MEAEHRAADTVAFASGAPREEQRNTHTVGPRRRSSAWRRKMGAVAGHREDMEGPAGAHGTWDAPGLSAPARSRARAKRARMDDDALERRAQSEAASRGQSVGLVVQRQLRDKDPWLKVSWARAPGSAPPVPRWEIR